MMRLFIGIPFAEKTRSQIRREVAQISSTLTKGKLTNWEGYHITLKFLGEVQQQQMETLAGLMNDARFSTEPFELQFTEPGTFKKRGGYVLWLGVLLTPQLLALQQEVVALTVQAGFEPEARAFTSHLTLGRGVRYAECFEKTAALWKLKNLKERVERVALFQSTQVEGRLAYVPLIKRVLGES